MKNKKTPPFALIFLLWACKESPTAPEPEPEPPNLPAPEAVTVALPQNAPDPVQSHYTQIYGPLALALQHSANIKNVVPKHDGTTWTWSYTPAGAGPIIVIIKAVELSGDSSAWTISWNGDIGGANLNNWISAEGKISADGLYGRWKFYLFRSVFLVGTAIWRKSSHNAIVIEAARLRDVDPNDDIDGVYVNYRLIGNPDGSGNLEVTEKSIKIFAAAWDSSGAGTWSGYDASTGQQTGGGSWGP
jgi:hypothetical protein